MAEPNSPDLSPGITRPSIAALYSRRMDGRVILGIKSGVRPGGIRPGHDGTNMVLLT
jgi:hypothetical protein